MDYAQRCKGTAACLCTVFAVGETGYLGEQKDLRAVTTRWNGKMLS